MQIQLAALLASGGCAERPTRRGAPRRRSHEVSARTSASGTNAGVRGASICQRKECGGASIFQHQRRRCACKECGGGGASASTSPEGADARSAAWRRMSQ